tara:strand:- start:45 stop:1664 length:1620 start_codon:yes stop_codon:yes gene_type:complete
MADYKEQGLYQEGNSLFDDIFVFGDLEVQNINVLGIITATTFSGVDATSLKDGTGTVQIQATTTGATHSGRAVFNEVELQGKVYDSDGDFGTSGQVLSSDGTDIEWVNAGSLSAGSAAQVTVANEGSDTTCFPLFSTGATGNLQIKSNANLTFNSSTGALSATSLSGSINASNLTGTIASGRLTGTYGINISGNAGSSDTVDVTSETSTSTTQYLLFTHTHGSQLTIKQDTGLSYVPSTNQLTASGGFFGDLEGNVTATTISGTLQTAAQTNITSVGTLTGLTVDGNLILDSTSNYIHIKGALYDKDGQSGSADQVLVSTGTQVDWKDTTSLTASNSQKITIAESDSNSDFPITFSAAPGQSGGNTLLSDNQFTYNADSNVVTAGTFSGSGASLTSLNANNLNSGTVADARLSNSSLFVQGMIMMYNGSSAPSGWAICNGQNGTPDLRDRFIVGTGSSYSLGNTGGANSVTLTTSQMPSHKHNTTFDNKKYFPGGGSTSINFGGAGGYPADTFTMSNEGGGQSHENRPPYYALMFIMKL